VNLIFNPFNLTDLLMSTCLIPISIQEDSVVKQPLSLRFDMTLLNILQMASGLHLTGSGALMRAVTQMPAAPMSRISSFMLPAKPSPSGKVAFPVDTNIASIIFESSGIFSNGSALKSCLHT